VVLFKVIMAAADGMAGLKRELPHILVLVILILVVLVLLTKFQWIHCSQVPGNWCDIYCNYILQAHSRVAIISDPAAGGIGDAHALEALLRRTRWSTYVEPIPRDALSSGAIKGYDLLVLEQMRKITFGQARAIDDFVRRGGTLLWIGDAASEYYIDENDLAAEMQRISNSDEAAAFASKDYPVLQHVIFINGTWYNESSKQVVSRGQIDDAVREWKRWHLLYVVNRTKGFGLLEQALAAKFVRTQTTDSPIFFKTLLPDNVLLKGLKYEFQTTAKQFTIVSEDPSLTTRIVAIKSGNKEYTGVFETRYAGKIVYVSFPLEEVNSTTFFQNLFDYLVTC